MYKKKDLVDFISENFSKKNGKRIPKAELNRQETDNLLKIIKDSNMENRFKNWLNQPKPIKFYADATDENGNDFTEEITAIDENEAKKYFANAKCTINKLVPAKGHHICKYCNGIANGSNKDELCEDCKESFGHHYYSEL